MHASNEIDGGSPANFFLRHWRGDFSLGVSYWCIGFLFVGAVALLGDALTEHMPAAGFSLRSVAIAGLSSTLLTLALWLWAVIGIWRSASRHVGRGGSAGWAGAAKVMVVIGALSMAGKMATTIGPNARELFLIAIGSDPLGTVDVSLAVNGKAVVVRGALREGAAAEVERVFRSAPDATMLVLNSNGGRLLEGERLAKYVRERHLDTYVEGMCVSACTYVFLAGKERAATPNARIGFHQPGLAGADAAAAKRAVSDMAETYRAARLPESFIARVSRTAHEDMWYPTRAELIAANVITRTSLGGEAAVATMGLKSKQDLQLLVKEVPLWAAIEQRFPQEFERALENAWAARERGANDAEVFNAMRSVVADIFPLLLKSVDDGILDRYAGLFVDQLIAARAVSDDACGKLMEAELDVAKTLPGEIVEREQQLIVDALAAPSRSVKPHDDPAAFGRVARNATAMLAEDHLDVIRDPDAYRDRNGLRCDAFISFYSALLKLPESDRRIALRGLFQGE